MRQRTIVVLLALVVLFALFGWKVLGIFGWILVTLLTVLVLLFAALFLGAWLLKRRMQRKLANLQGAFVQAIKDAQHGQHQVDARRDAIDVEPTGIRDDGR